MTWDGKMSVSIARRASTMSGGSQQRQTTSQFESQRDEIKRRQSVKYQFPNFMFSEEEEAALFNEVKLIKLSHLYLSFYKYHFVEKKEQNWSTCILHRIFSRVNIPRGPKSTKGIVINCKWYIHSTPLFAENKIDIITGFKTLSNGL